jgi:hypothetical protein
VLEVEIGLTHSGYTNTSHSLQSGKTERIESENRAAIGIVAVLLERRIIPGFVGGMTGEAVPIIVH